MGVWRGGDVGLNNVEAIILGPESLVRAYEAELASMPALKVIVGLRGDGFGGDGTTRRSTDSVASPVHSTDSAANPAHSTHSIANPTINANPAHPNSGTITFRGHLTLPVPL